jgi:hypothetical protein
VTFRPAGDRRQRQQLLDHRLLLHRVDKTGVADENLVDLAARVRVELDLHRADQFFEVRRVAHLHRVRHHLGADAIQEAEALVADRAGDDGLAGIGQLAQLGGERPQDVRVQAAAKTFVGRDDDEPAAFTES